MKSELLMKAEFKEGILTLRGDLDEEKEWLDKAFSEGIMFVGASEKKKDGRSYITACLPSVSNVKQFHFTEKELSIVQGSLKQCENVLSFLYREELVLLEKKLGIFSLSEFLEKSAEILGFKVSSGK